MDEQVFEGLKHYKNTADFRKKYGSTDDEPTLGTFFADIASEGLEAWSNKMDRELIGTIFDPYGIWYVEDKEKANKYDKIKEIDKKRPGLNTLKYEPIPKDKVAGQKSKFALFAGLWNKFVEEVEAGRAGIAEVLVVAYETFHENGQDVYYFKVADTDGTVLNGGVRKIVFPKMNNYVDELVNGWITPEAYRDLYKRKPEEEYIAYQAAYMANAYGDKIDTEDRWHAYVIRCNIKGKDYYGLITKMENDDFKMIKDSFSFLTPEKCFAPMTNFTITFDW